MQLTFDQIRDILIHNKPFSIDDASMEKVKACYQFLEQFANDRIIYGINTGFGPMAQWRVEDSHLQELQYNIIRSHSTGAGEALSDIDVKAAMIARLGSFMQARSGVHPEIIELLEQCINRNIFPFIPRHGSVGASGDLVQLAHIALCLIGEGKVQADEQREVRERDAARHARHGDGERLVVEGRGCGAGQQRAGAEGGEEGSDGCFHG